MRKISLVLVAAMLLITGNVLATEAKPKNPTKSLSAQISQMLSLNTFTEEEVDLTAQVRFTLNNKHEIVVLSVDSENESLEGFVKTKLNYQKVDVESYKEGKMYTVPVRIAD